MQYLCREKKLIKTKVGVLLLNLGTPEKASVSAVRKYLREFLRDPRVVDIPKFFRFLLLYLIILPFRPKKSLEAYKKIWTNQGSPLLVYSEKLVAKINDFLKQKNSVSETLIPKVLLAMRYGKPSIATALNTFHGQGVDRVLVFPQFPQYSSAAYGSALSEVYLQSAQHWNIPYLETIEPFYVDPDFITIQSRNLEGSLQKDNYDFLIFSYHGVPLRHCQKSVSETFQCKLDGECCSELKIENRNCYRAQCLASTRAIVTDFEKVSELDLPPWEIAFQSRLGRTPWIRPYSDELIENKARLGAKKGLIICPSFTVDCLETLEEIQIRADADFKKLGGDKIDLVPCMNDSDDWAQVCASWITRRNF